MTGPAPIVDIDARVQALVDAAPPLTAEMRDRLRTLLAGPPHDGGAATTAAPTSSLTTPAAKVGGRRNEE